MNITYALFFHSKNASYINQQSVYKISESVQFIYYLCTSISIVVGDIIVKRRGFGIPLISLTPPHFVPVPWQDLEFQMSYVVWKFVSLGTLKVERFGKLNNFKMFVSNETKEPILNRVAIFG